MKNILQKGTVKSINVSLVKGTKKSPVPEVMINSLGIIDDAHAGDWHRQVSFLADESVDVMRERMKEITAGDFAENITTLGVNFKNVSIGQKMKVGGALLEVTQIGKECHSACDIKKKVGYCIMPTEGIFAKVLAEGRVKIGDEVIIYE
ncbi:MAG TPA: MOSC domain-containing protein [Candidatus Wallbacteria bacterium]|nr:MOSC domain-containing protein [Candidatus Wallbacteria bacterium]